jgi:membrane protease YdiL (CAAX protease family)
MKRDTLTQINRDKWILILSAWILILVVSDLPDIIYKSIYGLVPAGLIWIKPVFAGLFFCICRLWKRIYPLRHYALILLVFFGALAFSQWIKNTVWWKGLISEDQPSFFLVYLRPFLRDIGVTVFVIAALWIIKRNRREFFLVRGELNAPIEPVYWLGIREGGSWRIFTWIFALVAAICVAVPTFIAMRQSSEVFVKALPLLPVILIFSAINAFNEEIYFRASLLSTLTEIIGKNHTLLINAAFFGLAHYLYGSPPGVTGFLMTAFLAWIMGKSILETRGIFRAWTIHFLPDIVIFYSYAISWLQG